jgi:DNA polymerase-3 subunit epsilon
VSWFGSTPERRRAKALRQARPGPLADHLAVPQPALDTAPEALRLLAIDVEATGLDPASGELLSVGFVPVDGGSIDLSGAAHYVIASGAAVGQSATIHGLTDDAVAGGVPLEEAVSAVLAALTGRVLLAHFARIELGYLSAACERLWGAPLPLRAIDTLELQDRVVRSRLSLDPREPNLRLWPARERFGLPVYRAHHALTDALACAELYLAQVAELEQRGSLTLKSLSS